MGGSDWSGRAAVRMQVLEDDGAASHQLLILIRQRGGSCGSAADQTGSGSHGSVRSFWL